MISDRAREQVCLTAVQYADRHSLSLILQGHRNSQLVLMTVQSPEILMSPVS